MRVYEQLSKKEASGRFECSKNLLCLLSTKCLVLDLDYTGSYPIGIGSTFLKVAYTGSNPLGFL